LPRFEFHIPPTGSDTQKQYWLLEFFDVDNGDGHVDIGRLFMGRAFIPEVNYSQDNQLTIEPLTDVEESLGGLRSYWERGLRRTFRCSFQHLSETEMFDDVMRIMLRSGISRQVFLVPDPDDESFGNRRSFLATFKQIPAMQQVLVERGTTAFDLQEVL